MSRFTNKITFHGDAVVTHETHIGVCGNAWIYERVRMRTNKLWVNLCYWNGTLIHSVWAQTINSLYTDVTQADGNYRNRTRQAYWYIVHLPSRSYISNNNNNNNKYIYIYIYVLNNLLHSLSIVVSHLHIYITVVFILFCSSFHTVGHRWCYLVTIITPHTQTHTHTTNTLLLESGCGGLWLSLNNTTYAIGYNIEKCTEFQAFFLMSRTTITR